MFFKKEIEKQLDEKIKRIQNNFENNYKDAAQMNLKELSEVQKNTLIWFSVCEVL